MIPVEDGKTSTGLRFKRLAVSAHTFQQSRIPRRPVAQLAFPEFTITARTRLLLFACDTRPTSTGAATIKFLVNNAAAVVFGSATISAKSGFPLALMPALTAENLNPFGRKTGPGWIIPAVSPESSRAQEGSRTVAIRL